MIRAFRCHAQGVGIKIRTVHYLNATVDYFHYLFQRFQADQCTRAAAALAYTSLLALVPLLTVIFIALAAVPAFSGWQSAIESFIFDNFVPAFGDVLQKYLLEFTSKARGLQAMGVVVLGFTVLLMMATVEDTFNVIWRIKKKRSLVTRFMVYWAVLTLGPLLIGSGVVATSYIVSLPQLETVNASYGFERKMLTAFPIMTTTIGFMMFFRLIPNRPVPLAHAFVGGVAASVMFEIAKRGFAYYVANFPQQEAIYGAFATLPLFLVWIYVSWLIVLLGAEITVCLTTFNALAPRRLRQFSQEEFYAAYRILGCLHDAQHEGRACSENELMQREKKLPYTLVSDVLETLAHEDWVTRDEDYNWLLSRDLKRQTVSDLLRILPAPVPANGELDLNVVDDRDRALQQLFEVYGEWTSRHLSLPLGEVLDYEDHRDVAASLSAPVMENETVTSFPQAGRSNPDSA